MRSPTSIIGQERPVKDLNSKGALCKTLTKELLGD